MLILNLKKCLVSYVLVRRSRLDLYLKNYGKHIEYII